MNRKREFQCDVNKFTVQELDNNFADGLFGDEHRNILVRQQTQLQRSLVQNILERFQVDIKELDSRNLVPNQVENLHMTNLITYTNMCHALNKVIPFINRDRFHLNLFIYCPWQEIKRFLEHVINYFMSIEGYNERWEVHYNNHVAHQNDLAQVRQQVDKLRQEVDALQAKVDGRKEQEGLLEEEKEELLTKLDTTSYKEITQEKQNLKMKLKDSTNQCEALMEKLCSVNKKIKDLELQHVTDDNQILLRKQVEEEKGNVEKKKLEWKQLDEEMKSDRVKLQQLESINQIGKTFQENLEKACHIKDETLKDQDLLLQRKMELSSKSKDVRILEGKIEDCREATTELKKRSEKKARENEEKKKRIVKMREDMNREEREMKEVLQKIKEIKEQELERERNHKELMDILELKNQEITEIYQEKSLEMKRNIKMLRAARYVKPEPEN